jgi:hypothetical protein
MGYEGVARVDDDFALAGGAVAFGENENENVG